MKNNLEYGQEWEYEMQVATWYAIFSPGKVIERVISTIVRWKLKCRRWHPMIAIVSAMSWVTMIRMRRGSRCRRPTNSRLLTARFMLARRWGTCHLVTVVFLLTTCTVHYMEIRPYFDGFFVASQNSKITRMSDSCNAISHKQVLHTQWLVTLMAHIN